MKKLTTCSALPANFSRRLWILSGNADRAGIKVADPHHDAAHYHQRGRSESIFLGAQQGCDDHVPAGLELSIGLNNDAISKPIENERVLRLGQA